MYVSRQADGIRFESPPSEVFASLEEASKFVEAKRKHA